MDTPARRLLDAVRAAAANAGAPDDYPRFLDRVGLRGLYARTSDDPCLALDPDRVSAHQRRDTLIVERAAEISGRLVRDRVWHCFARGVALVGTAYEPGDRLLSNADLYVPIEHRDAAINTLERMGYAPLPDHQQAGPPEHRSVVAMRSGGEGDEGTTVNVHWSLDPVERMLPRRERSVPERLWESIVTQGDLRVPAPEHHAAVLVHHLVHTDLTHVRGLLDLAYVFESFDPQGGAEYLATCAELRIGRFARAVARIVAGDFGVVRPATVVDEPVRWDPFVMELDLERWLTLVHDLAPHEAEGISPGRIRRRLRLLDAGGANSLAQDALLPPAAFLKWRWPGKGLAEARLNHYRQLARKVMGRG